MIKSVRLNAITINGATCKGVEQIISMKKRRCLKQQDEIKMFGVKKAAV